MIKIFQVRQRDLQPRLRDEITGPGDWTRDFAPEVCGALKHVLNRLHREICVSPEHLFEIRDLRRTRENYILRSVQRQLENPAAHDVTCIS